MDIFDPTGTSMELPNLDRRMLYGLMLSQLATTNTPQWNPQQSVMIALQQRRLAEQQRQKMEEKLAPTYQKIGDSLVQIGPMYERQGDRVVRRQGLPEITPVFQEPAEPTGAFAGTGIEAQMLNIVLDPTIPDSDPRKVLAKQRLGRATTTVTPEGTFMQPGYDVDAVFGGAGAPAPGAGGAPDPTVIPNVSDAQRVRAGQAEQLEQLNAAAPDYVPTLSEGFGAEMVPEFIARQWFYSDEYKQAVPNQEAWSATASKIINGGNASDEDVARIQNSYWPVQGDTPAVVEQKRKMRASLQAAIKQGLHPSQTGLPWWGGNGETVQGDAPGGKVRWELDANGNLVRAAQ